MFPSRILPALMALVLAAPAAAVTRHVYNATDFNNLPSLNAGDIVVLHSGTYGAINKTLVSTISSDATAQTDPIIVYAEVNGGVDVTAPSQITLQGRGIILTGLDFISGSGMLDNGNANPAWVIRTDANSRFMVISNIRFLNCVSGDDYGHWLYLEGFNHTIEYCLFEGKSTQNATIGFKRNTAEAGITTTRNHRLRYCYFGPRECSVTLNGYETIRIGDSSSQAHDMNITIEQNVFYRAIWRNDGQKPNDMEIISNKSKGNKIINNTFLESYGQITLRHGDACTVDGNYIFGAGYYSGSSILLGTANANQTGIRVIGQDHIVRNNYLVNLIGTNLRAALCVMGGDSGFADGNGSGGSNGYEAAHNALIYNNTFIDCKEINLGYLNGSSTVLPTGVKIYNNAWQGSGTSNGVVRNTSFNHGGSAGNYLYHSAGSYGWTGLGGTYSSSVSPAITESFDNYKIPTASSPLLNVASTTLVASHDLRDLARPASNKDIGAFEREVSGSGLKPLLRNQVGPEFAGGPSGTYPSPGNVGTSPVITTTSLANGAVGTAYSQTLQATGGDGTLVWSVISGSLPTSLSLSSAGVISGTPSATQTSNFTVQVADIDSDLDTKALSIVVDPAGTVATPSFSPAAGSYASAQSVAITTSTSGATIRYTTDGSTPTTSVGTVYSSAISIATTTTLKAIAYKTGWTNSAVLTGDYTITTSDPEIVPTSSPDSTPWDTVGSNGPANLWDGVTTDGGSGSRWASDASPSTLASAPRWVNLDLGASSQLTKFVVHPYQSRAYHYKIYVSSDGTNWGTAVVNVQNSTGAASYTHTLGTAATGRYVRLWVDGVSGSSTTWASINEFDIFGTAASGGGGAFLMSSNQVVMEAENANTRTAGGGKSWDLITQSGASGLSTNNALQALPNTGTTASAPGASTCRADYQIVVPSGAASTFYVHVRARGPSGSDNSVFISVNGSTSSYQTFTTTSSLGWKKASSTIALPVGTQSLTIWMREDGTIVDKIVVSSSSTLPTGTGPAESGRN